MKSSQRRSHSVNRSKTASRGAEHCDVLLTGTGSLAESTLLCWPLADAAQRRQRVVILSRSEVQAKRLAELAQFRAAALGSHLDCFAAATNWEEADLRQHFAKYQPRLIVHSASLQSPWPKADESSAWRLAMRQFGFGLTTVLQAVLALRLGRAARAATPRAAFVNCCYPDAVNPLLNQAGIPVTCGAGNVAIVAALWQARAPSSAPVRILAHHAHLTQLIRPASGPGIFPRVWIGDDECDHVADILSNVEFPKGPAMNHLTGAVTAVLAHALQGRNAVRSHAPGPFGWVGGYPVVAGSGKVKLDLPRVVTASEARAFNEQAQLAEGIESIGKQGLRYAPALAAELRRAGSAFAAGFAPNEIEEAAIDLLSVRQRLGGNAP